MLSRNSIGKQLVRNWLRLGRAGVPQVKPFILPGPASNSSSMASIHTYGIHNHNGEEYEKDQTKAGDHSGRQQNHIWSKEEIEAELNSLYRHKPVSFSDKVMNGLVSKSSHEFRCTC